VLLDSIRTFLVKLRVKIVKTIHISLLHWFLVQVLECLVCLAQGRFPPTKVVLVVLLVNTVILLAALIVQLVFMHPVVMLFHAKPAQKVIMVIVLLLHPRAKLV